MLNGQPLNEQQKLELNSVCSELPFVQELKAKDEEIIEDLEGLKKGQAQLDQKVETGFEKGRKRMDGIEGELKEVKQSLDGLKDVIIKQHEEIKSKITDNEISRLKTALDERDKAIEKKDGRAWEVIKIGLTAVASIIVTYYLVVSGLK